MNGNDECIFCKIRDGKIPSPKVYEDENYYCVRDIHPQARTHLLVIPKSHVASLDEVFPEAGGGNAQLVGGLFGVAARIAREQGLRDGGYRTVINTGPGAGQTVFHLHLHLLGGGRLKDGFA